MTWNQNQCTKNKQWNHRFTSESEAGSSSVACSWFHYAEREAPVWHWGGRSLFNFLKKLTFDMMCTIWAMQQQKERKKCLDMIAFRSDRGKRMITHSHAQRKKKTQQCMVLTGVWLAGVKRHWTHSTLTFLCVCVCVCVCVCGCALHGVVSLNTGCVGWRFASHRPHSVWPRPACSRVHALLACDGSVGFPTERKSTERSTFRTGVGFTSAALGRLMTLVPVSVAVRNKWPSEAHYASVRFGDRSDTAPDYQIYPLNWTWSLFHKCQLENCTERQRWDFMTLAETPPPPRWKRETLWHK